jgi:hypothetical protein
VQQPNPFILSAARVLEVLALELALDGGLGSGEYPNSVPESR